MTLCSLSLPLHALILFFVLSLSFIFSPLHQIRVVDGYSANDNRTFCLLPHFSYTLADMPLIDKASNTINNNSSTSRYTADLLNLYAQQLKSAVDHINTKGWSHCDIKTSNVFVTNGAVLLGDYDACTKHGEEITRTTRSCLPAELQHRPVLIADRYIDYAMLSICLLTFAGLISINHESKPYSLAELNTIVSGIPVEVKQMKDILIEMLSDVEKALVGRQREKMT